MADKVHGLDINGDQWELQDLPLTQEFEAVKPDILSIPTELAKRPIQLCFNNITVLPADWTDQSASPDIPGYPFRASLTTSGVTSDYSPDVRFDITAATLGTLAPVAKCTNGVVYIYASAAPTQNIEISTIICTKAA